MLTVKSKTHIFKNKRWYLKPVYLYKIISFKINIRLKKYFFIKYNKNIKNSTLQSKKYL